MNYLLYLVIICEFVLYYWYYIVVVVCKLT